MPRRTRLRSNVLPLIAVILLAAFLPPMALSQRSLGSEPFIDRDYIFALAAANRFLSAWQDRDPSRGLHLLTPSLRRRHGEDRLRRYLMGLTNPINAAFEVGLGNRLPDGRFAFDVQLYTYRFGELIEPRRFRPAPSRIVLRQVGPEDWLVDDLP